MFNDSHVSLSACDFPHVGVIEVDYFVRLAAVRRMDEWSRHKLPRFCGYAVKTRIHEALNIPGD